MKIIDVVEELRLHFERVNNIIPGIESYTPLKPEYFTNIEVIKTIDSFIFRFIKIQDRMGEKLFPLVLQVFEEYKGNMPLIDILNKLERLEVIESVDQWIDFRKLRNTLTHDYPDNEKEIISAIALALKAFGKMEAIFNNIVSELKRRKILNS